MYGIEYPSREKIDESLNNLDKNVLENKEAMVRLFIYCRLASY